MKDNPVLKLLDKLEGVFTRGGINYRMMRTILQIKLMMDGRRTPTLLAAQKKESKEKKEGSPLGVQWFYVLIGLMMTPLMFLGGSYMLSMSMLFGFAMFMITTTLVSDFSSVMLDLRDKDILFSKPVDRRTLNMAKSIHILIYLFILTFSLMGPSLVFSLFKQGIPFFLIYIVLIVLMDCFILVITALLYLLIMRFFDGEKIKDIINYMQIMLTVGITVGYQLVIRLFDVVGLSIAFKAAWWQYLISPVWFASVFEVLLGGARDLGLLLLAACAVVLPIVLMVVYVRVMPLFERSLQKLAEQGVGGKDSGRMAAWLSRLVCRNPIEGMFFRFTWSMMRNERDFKLKVYPTVGLSLVFPFLFMFNQVWDGTQGGIGASKTYLFVYFSAMLLTTVVHMLRYSASYKGAWIYRVIPLPETSPIHRGMLKAAVLRLVVPVFAVMAVVFTWLYGVRIIPDLVAVFFAQMIYAVICFQMFPKSLPFSEKYEASKQSDSTFRVFGLMLILLVMAAVHLLFTLIPAGSYIYLAVLVIANTLLWRMIFPHKSMTSGGFTQLRG